MPLLKKKPFEKAPVPKNLRDDEEVFHCTVTNELFRNYEEFSERMFLCNSMVWTCSLTGKSNLTYAEALESEENAKNSLKEFPTELKIPILYLATKTKRTAFADMADDVFMYAKDRYFIGENIETCFTGSKWKDSHVLQVIPPSPDKVKTPPKNGHTAHLPGSLYKYEIEHLDADDEDISEIMIVDYNQIRRKKGSFSREKCKLFLKQYVEQDERDIFVIKSSAVHAFNLKSVTFETIFNGPAPEFDASKRFEKNVNGKKVRQESLHKFLTKNANFVKSGNNVDLLEKMKKREEEFKLQKQQKKEQALELKQKRKEESIVLAGHLRNWFVPSEDLELIDQQKLPKATPVKLKVSEGHIGDMLMVMEFANTFSKLLSTKDFFPGGLSVDIMERALTENEVAGPLIDLIQMFLVALFNVQDEEATQYRTNTENPSSIKQDETSNNMNVHEATRLATIASTWSKKYQGLPLDRLPLYSLTVSEVLRLHLLASGAIINNTGARWRYAQRGGYTSEDDPGLYLRLHSPHILKALKVHNVVELPISDKLKILSCLINQLLTYADVRDVVEEGIEEVKQVKADIKMTLVAEKKREQEFLTARYKLKKMVKADPNLTSELHKLEAETERKKGENEYKLEELKKALCKKQVVMGHDRAFRQYLKLESVPGFFVNYEEENPGTCLDAVVEQAPHLVNADRDELLAHLKKTAQDSSSSDKENSPSKNSKKLNGSVNGVREQKPETCDELDLCSTDPSTCTVHTAKNKSCKWCFYHEKDTFQNLIDSLNKRGVRENELRQNLLNDKDEIEKVMSKTPVHCLNEESEHQEESKQVKKAHKARYDNANFGYSTDTSAADILHNTLIENILELEEKITVGNLGTPIKRREKWRTCLHTKNYKELDKTLNRKADDSDSSSDLSVYQDPGDCLNSPSERISNNGIDPLLTQDENTLEAIHSLSIALAQIARSVDERFLKKPLGRMSVGRSDVKYSRLLDKWEESLLASTSFSQVFLHYSTLDSCIMWSKSVLRVGCRICRRRNDSENMLLCDMCNLGHHLYCLKPKLKSVPSGDWFCKRCEKERKAEAPVVVEPRVKKRPIFRDEEIESEEAQSNEENENEEIGDEKDLDENNMTSEGKVHLCRTCGSGGEVILCKNCCGYYHIECVEPPLRRAPRGPWFCMFCKKNDRKRHYDPSYVNGSVVQRTGKLNGQRRCAAQALFKIHHFAKTLRQLSRSDDSSEDEVVSKRSSRRDDARSDLPLHNSALHAVLAEIMKDCNAWPFLRPVQKTEVPDYYDVITKPMDFGTIKYKLNMGEYHEDAQFMSDALLVFQNCNTYNHTEDDVYKCGVELLKHFQQKCREMGLKLPDELDYDSRPKKKIRTK